MFCTRQHLWFRSLSLFLAFVLVFQLLPATIRAAENIGIGKEQTAEPLTVMGEVTELRTETEKHYRLSDGSYVAVDYGMPIHLEDSDGSWVDIDNTLSAATAFGAEGVSSYIATNEEETKIFAATFAPDEPLFSAQTGDYGVSMSMLQPATATQMQSGMSAQNWTDTNQQFAPAQAVVVSAATADAVFSQPAGGEESIVEQIQLPKLSSAVVYSDILPGVDLQYDIVGRDIKESIIVHRTQSQQPARQHP